MKKRSSKNKWSWKRKSAFCMLPSLAGTAVFFAIPFIRMVYYSLIQSQFDHSFVWLDNYREVWENHYFQLAVRNSLLLIGIGVPLLLLLALGITVRLQQLRNQEKRWRKESNHLLQKGSRGSWLWTAFVLPMVIPTAGITPIWQKLFAASHSALPIYLLFLWKNTGICVILLSAALTALSEGMFEAARLDGADGWRLHAKVTIPAIFPTILFCGLLAVVNSFRIFKESYLYYGTDYPPDHSYTLQYYMNNHFLKLNYQRLACSAVFTAVLVLVFVTVCLRWQRRYEV